MREGKRVGSPYWPYASASLNSGDQVTERLEAREWLQRPMLADVPATSTPHERDGRYISAPTWPWLAAGFVFAALFLVFVLVEYYFS